MAEVDTTSLQTEDKVDTNSSTIGDKVDANSSKAGDKVDANSSTNIDLTKYISLEEHNNKFSIFTKERDELKNVIKSLHQSREDFEKQIKDQHEQSLLESKILHSNELRKRDFVDSVMQDVAPGSREHARLLLDGYVARGDFDPLNQDKETKTLAQEARDRIAKLHPGIYTNSILQTVTTSTPGTDWDKFHNWGEVPRDLRTQVPDEHFNRLTRTAGTGRKLV